MRKTAVVIPSWNAKDFISLCLDSLLAQTQVCTIIVVDNGSTDGSVDQIKQNYASAQLVELDKNYGFAGGVNRGIEAAIELGCDYVVLFNNDAVADKNWLKELVGYADSHPKAGIVTSKFLRLSDRKVLDSTGDFYSIWGLPFPRGRDEFDEGQFDSPATQVIFGASGGASLYRVSALKEVGLFDEDFFAYYEDVDISFRMQLAGWEVLYCPTAKAYHHVGWTSSKMGHFARYHTTKNFVYLYLKNMPGGLFWRYLPYFLGGFILMTGHSLKRGQFGVVIGAWWSIITHLPVMLVRRHRIQSSKRVTSGYIDSLLYKKLPPTSKSLHRLRARLAKRN